jgi:hypothetical protein
VPHPTAPPRAPDNDDDDNNNDNDNNNIDKSKTDLRIGTQNIVILSTGKLSVFMSGEMTVIWGQQSWRV